MIFREILVEILSTFTIVFLTSYARLSADLRSSFDKMQIGLVNAVATGVFILLCFPRARCHFNPILTISDVIFKDLNLMSGIIIMLSQLVGCLTAYALVVLSITDKQSDYLSEKSIIGLSYLKKEFSTIQAFSAELIFSLIFVYACLEHSDIKRKGQYWIEYYALVRGVIILAASIASEAISGCDFNPFAILSAALISTKLESYQWLYYISPIIGGTIGGLIYNRQIVERFFMAVKNEDVVSK